MAERKQQIELSAYETSDLGEGFIWGVVGICLAVLLACALTVIWLYPSAARDRIIAGTLPNYPAPQLQSDPVADMRAYRAAQVEQLGHAPVPIGTAMQQVVTEGIADWPSP